MTRRVTFIPYRPKTILNKSKHTDHWFWTRYSAYPYIGCQHGCEFCYCREQKYSPYDDPHDFAYQIKVKENAPELLRKGLLRAPVEAIFTGDYQPAERKFQISRRMLEVCLELGFPVFVLERSPLILRDLDLLQDIHHKARTIVAFSIITTPESTHYQAVQDLEHLAPKVEKRFQAMEKIAAAGIPTGVCMMPILPGLCDDPENLEAVAHWTSTHGGSFILASGLTLADQQRAYFFNVLGERHPSLLERYQAWYPPGNYTPANYNWREVALRLREACQSHGIQDRMPRPIIPGDGRALNKQIVERLANYAYTLELENQPQVKIWAYRKAAWAVEDLQQDLRLVQQSMGRRGLEIIPDIGPRMASVIFEWINELSQSVKS